MLLLRGVFGSSDAVAAGRWPRDALSNGREIGGKTIGLVGFGSIGRVTAGLARGLGMRVLACDAALAPDDPAYAAHGTQGTTFDALIAQADVVSIHVPLVDSTRHLFDARRIAAMKRGAVLVNAARGGIVDEPSLVAALKSGHLGGRRAGLLRDRALAGRQRLRGLPEPAADAARRRPVGGSEHTDLAPHRREGPRGSGLMATVSLDDARTRTAGALGRAGAAPAMAEATADALVLAEAQGLASHGLGRVAQYATHLRNGRVDGAALPSIARSKGAVAIVDAHAGLAFPACALAVEEATRRAGEFGIGFVGVVHSHHAGVIVDHLRPAAARGMVGLGFANSPAAMPAAGGRHPIFGTNPVAAIFPRRDAPPLSIDLSLSEVARGKVLVAAKAGKPIPLGWALDAEGRPTTDANAALLGSMLAFGSGSVDAPGTKGAMLALVVELLVTALIGANFGHEASSFFVDEGNRPGIGQAFLVIDPGALAGRDSFLDRIDVLVREMLLDEGVRLPGARREALLQVAERDGLTIPDALWASLSV